MLPTFHRLRMSSSSTHRSIRGTARWPACCARVSSAASCRRNRGRTRHPHWGHVLTRASRAAEKIWPHSGYGQRAASTGLRRLRGGEIGSGIIEPQYVAVIETLHAHAAGSPLAHSHTVAPAAAAEVKQHRHDLLLDNRFG